MIRNQAKILMIDDNRHGLAARRTLLEGQGFLVETAQGGVAGLEAFQAGTFDLVVTDFRMPGGPNGPEVVRRIRTQSPTTPIVMLSGFSKKLGLTPDGTGADAVLTKGPSEAADLLRAVVRLLKARPGRETRSERSSGSAVESA